ncbi:hypothetical protein [Vreelandella titanicae]|uniref:hypothetical protein n=1 Tax=Vreelandella titanicae TaxID=664683 RepID=UPI0038086F5F
MLVNNLTALNILPQEQLNLAHLHETSELNRYRWLTLSFQPFDSPISRLMSAIGMECAHRILNLQEVARQMELSACVNTDQMMKISLPNKNIQHFFVVDELMGRHALVGAEEAANATCTYFGWLLETNATPELHKLLFNCLTQKNNEYHVLQECREQRKLGLF